MSGGGKTPVHLFVVGVARSGTTALAHLLNAHPEVCIGIERYKRYFRNERQFPLELLTKDRFFSFATTDSNNIPGNGGWEAVYRRMARKWDQARVIGDKEGYDLLEILVQQVPSARVVYMLRDVHRVASSWNVRAANPKDRAWPSHNDFRIAVNRWNEANSLAYYYAPVLADRFLVIHYESFFAGSKDYANALLRFAGLEPDEPQFMEAYEASVGVFQNSILNKPPIVHDRQADFIERETRRETYQLLLKLAEKQLAALCNGAGPSELRSEAS